MITSISGPPSPLPTLPSSTPLPLTLPLKRGSFPTSSALPLFMTTTPTLAVLGNTVIPLHGPPGIDKRSLVATITNLLKFDVYDLEVTAVPSNSLLRRLLVLTTPKSVVVLEDIDCSLELFDHKEKKTKPSHDHEPRPDPSPPAMPRNPHGVTMYNGGMVSLSGVLNFMDGLWSSCMGEQLMIFTTNRPKRLMIFTTNHPEWLNSALLRPGRMDRSIHLSYCGIVAFWVLARNYLDVADGHELMSKVDALLPEVNMTPVEVAEFFMGCDADAMWMVVEELRRRKAGMP